MDLIKIQPESEVFATEGATGIGAVREVSKDYIVIYIEGFGDQRIEKDQIAAVHDGKVVLKMEALPDDVRSAVSQAHDEEDETVHPHRPIS